MPDRQDDFENTGHDMAPEVIDLIGRFGIENEALTFLKQPKRLFINGAFRASSDGSKVEVFEPSTEKRLARIPSATTSDIDDAIAAARGALSGDWGRIKPNERESLLLKLADLIARDARIIAEIETLDNGKALGPCIDIDVMGGADLMRYMAGFATKIEGATREVSAPGDHLTMTVKSPVGVVGAIVPWNWPFSMAIWKLAAPLAAGCALVLKPAQETSLSMLYFARLVMEAGIPPGVINIVTGHGATLGNHMSAHSGIDKISFTGSTPIGKIVGSNAAQALSQVTLELGGKSPMVVFEDADLESVAAATRWSVFFNAGQVCSAGSRLYIHRSKLEAMLEAIVSVAGEMKMRPGLDPECDIGPVINGRAKTRILEFIDQAKAEGATLIYQGDVTEKAGYFVPPTIIYAPRNDLTIVQEEVFGPVLTVIAFDDEREAVQMANDNAYGLAASVWTRDISRAVRVSKQIDAGTVWVNAHDLVDSSLPFGGVKASGFGRDLGPEQLQYFLKTKTVWICAEPLDQAGS